MIPHFPDILIIDEAELFSFGNTFVHKDVNEHDGNQGTRRTSVENTAKDDVEENTNGMLLLIDRASSISPLYSWDEWYAMGCAAKNKNTSCWRS